jgi:glycosyltransferase involved in cell wall biosynthesis
MGLAKSGYEILLATNLADRRKDVEATGIPAIHVDLESRNLSLPVFFRKVREYHRIIKSTRPDLIFAVALKPVVTAAVAGLFSGRIPALYAFAGLGVSFSDRKKSWQVGFARRCFELTFRRLLNRPGRYCLFQNFDDRDLFLARQWTQPERCFVVKSAGVPVGEFPEKKWGGNEVVRFLFAGRMSREKGLEYLFEACRLLKARGIPFECRIAGFFDKTGIETVPRADLERYNQEGLIQWLGPRADIPALLNQADCFVFPSFYREGVPRVLLEACAAGIPSITTDNVGCRDVISHEREGLLIPPKNARALAEAMEYVVRHRGRLPDWGRAARAKAVEHFTIDRAIAAHCAIFDQILSSAGER